jgi:hypothetical protein
MRTVILMAAIAGALVHSSVQARADGPWCAYYTGKSGGASNCGFYSYEQCMATVSGVGGVCQPNVFYSAPRDARRRKPR